MQCPRDTLARRMVSKLACSQDVKDHFDSAGLLQVVQLAQLSLIILVGLSRSPSFYALGSNFHSSHWVASRAAHGL